MHFVPKQPVFLAFLAVLALALVLPACQSNEPGAALHPTGSPLVQPSPLGLPALAVPAENPMTAEAVELGRQLFFEVKLSSDNSVSCATCHDPARYFTDSLKVAKGVNGQSGTRNTPTVVNAAYNSLQFWDGRAPNLEEQASGPIANPIEMNLPHEACVTRLNADADYRAAFARVYGPGRITIRHVQQALASFERTVLAADAPFDRYQFGGDKQALTASAQRGLAVFIDKQRGNCATCHLIQNDHALFTDGKFHNLGTGMDANGELTDLGRYQQTKNEQDRGAFRTPSLRNVAMTAPYMHDGRLKTLKEVIDFYVGGGSSNPQLDNEINSLTLTAQDRADLLALLESLTGTLPANVKQSNPRQSALNR